MHLKSLIELDNHASKKAKKVANADKEQVRVYVTLHNYWVAYLLKCSCVPGKH
jgi:hypothetical protein